MFFMALRGEGPSFTGILYSVERRRGLKWEKKCAINSDVLYFRSHYYTSHQRYWVALFANLFDRDRSTHINLWNMKWKTITILRPFLSRFQPLWFLQRSIRLTLGLSFVWKGWWVALESKGRVMNINDQDGLQRYLRGVTSLWTTFAARKLNPGLTF